MARHSKKKFYREAIGLQGGMIDGFNRQADSEMTVINGL
jgi:hypothetical protein